MNILFVDDNRDVQNWGCRSTSISLHQLLSIENKVIATIDKRTVDKKIPMYLKQRRIQKYWSKLQNIFSINKIKNDFICDDPTKSLSNFLDFKQGNQTLKAIYDKALSSDIVVINGEGSMIFTTPPRRDLMFQLMIIELACYLKKPIFYINAMVSDCPVNGRNESTFKIAIQSLLKCQGVSLRDPYSYEMVKGHVSGINCKMIPDALFSWLDQYEFGKRSYLPENGDFIIPFPESNNYLGKLDFSQPYICIGGSSLSARNPQKAIPAYAKLVEVIKGLGLDVLLIVTSPEDGFLDKVSTLTDTAIVPVHVPILMGGSILANARLFISGRYHPSILASLGGTPSIFLGSNSHKTKSLQEVLEYKISKEFSAFPTTEECEEILCLAKYLINEGDKARHSVKEVVKKRAEESKRVMALINAS